MAFKRQDLSLLQLRLTDKGFTFSRLPKHSVDTLDYKAGAVKFKKVFLFGPCC